MKQSIYGSFKSVLKIYRLLSSSIWKMPNGTTYKQLAAEFGCGKTQVGTILFSFYVFELLIALRLSNGWARKPGQQIHITWCSKWMFENHGITDSQENICNSSCFSIMADECSDVSNREQFTICIRWVSEDIVVHEGFIGLYEVDSITADTLVHAIKDTLLRMNVKLDRCRGQC